MSIPAAILAGGLSRRMGEPKALVPFGAARLIDHVAARVTPQAGPILVNSNLPEISLAGAPTLPDLFPGHMGPLAGIHAALSHVAAHLPAARHCLILPVDGPFFPTDLVARLSASLAGPDEIALASSLGRLHPVLGLWPVSALPALTTWLENPPTLKVRAFVETLGLRTVTFKPYDTPFGPLDPFFNINTPDDLARARDLLGAMES